ncbi:MAG TPA: transposase [Methanospirillum sp.]|uniref:RNA-guided endonuclease InsQ/TnpB family protein n=1 Tax=Methanospirillum sp. TaxID=45200 RepID=UPI002CACDCA6|nr:transposase [Methanospirillum sp.]HPY61164.1 transposase [Methanospirillum sp.]
MLLCYTQKVYPDAELESALVFTLDACRFTYNKLLEHIRDTKCSKYDSQAYLVDLKEQHPFLQNVYSKTLQMVNHNLWSNIKALSGSKKKGRKVGKLRFRAKDRFRTFQLNQSGFSFTDKGLKLSKIGTLPVTFDVDPNTVKGVVITKKRNYWQVAVQVEEPDVDIIIPQSSVGIDLGLSSFSTDSNGLQIENPRFSKNAEPKLKKVHRSLSRKAKGSNNWKKAKAKLSESYEKVKNQRKDFAHKVSRMYVNTYDQIIVEDLNIKQLKEHKFKSTRRSVSDVSWNQFISFLTYKAESAGKFLIKVNPKNTSQICSFCGSYVQKDVSVRVHNCTCGLSLDRDYNAALNILNRGIGHPSQPVELQPLHHLSVMQVVSMKQEAPSSKLVRV